MMHSLVDVAAAHTRGYVLCVLLYCIHSHAPRPKNDDDERDCFLHDDDVIAPHLIAVVGGAEVQFTRTTY